jgi:hypothetical protein
MAIPLKLRVDPIQGGGAHVRVVSIEMTSFDHDIFDVKI